MTLPDYIAAHLKTPFQWGVNDCVLFALRWVEMRRAAQVIPAITWTNEKQAARAIKQHGGLVAAFDRTFARIAPNFAQDGDLALAGRIVYLFSGAHLVSPGKLGLVFKSRMEAEHAWSVR